MHSLFRIPLDLSFDTAKTCAIKMKPTSMQAKLLNRIDGVVIGEYTMMTAAHLDFIDRTLQHVRGNQLWLGAINDVLSGDFRQIGPVVLHDTLADSKAVSWINHPLYPDHIKTLKEPVRDASDPKWIQQVLDIGDRGSRHARHLLYPHGG
eukprot:TRINITY_DN12054_c0_g3_i1.p1 TRINITY_DN12054_c0_g3~~TRINITY_DN12054_c0_g3_i1.p1  ORF type:complete len:150 (+),score=12.92 TRINITY_DN12054_c0_g3_i1:142-591(+)